MNFKNTRMYKKGQLGEQIVDSLILNKGKFIPYAPVLDDAHVFDRLVASKDKSRLMIVEIKTVDARDYYPDTGISIRHYEEYSEIQERYGIDVWILFVDSKKKEIYGNTLKNLRTYTEVMHKGKLLIYPMIESNFTAVGKEIIYFPLKNMITVTTLSTEQCEELKSFNNKGYEQGLEWKDGYNEWKRGKEYDLKLDF